MPTINILNQTYLTKSPDENGSSLINMYLVGDDSQGKYPLTAYPTPGTILFSAGSSVIRALFTEHNVTYGVDGNQFFSVDSSGTRTNIHTINTSTGWCKIRGIADQLLIVDSSNGYCYKITANTFQTILTASSGNRLISANITAAGSGYSGTITVNITDSTGTGATATGTQSGGQITGITITNPGSGYTSPTITFSGSGGGSGGTAAATLQTNAFPTSIQDIECQDEFGLVLTTNSQAWNASSISDLTGWPPLSFASTTGAQNYNQSIVSVHRELYILGNINTEVWDNVGTVNFTFGRNTSSYVEYGCAARSSVAKADNTFFFLATSQTGGPVVMRMTGYTPAKISSQAIDYQLSTYATYNDAIGFTYQQEGHEFYVLIFPTAGTCWVYDISTELWHQRQSLSAGNQVAWLANCYTYNYGKCLIGDRLTGNIYQLDPATFTENSNAITRTLITHPFYQEGAWLRINKLQVDFDNAPGANLSNWNLFCSRDGGRTYGAAKAAFPTTDANGMYRVYWIRLGQAHSYTFKLQTNANMIPIILGAWANVAAGVSA